jgi:hypothetical protein
MLRIFGRTTLEIQFIEASLPGHARLGITRYLSQYIR